MLNDLLGVGLARVSDCLNRVRSKLYSYDFRCAPIYKLGFRLPLLGLHRQPENAMGDAVG